MYMLATVLLLVLKFGGFVVMPLWVCFIPLAMWAFVIVFLVSLIAWLKS